MNLIQPSYKERVRYIMYNDSIGTLILQTDPIGWNSDNKEYARNENYHGIVAKFSNSLVFIDD